jgi:hypothetical protein
LSGGTPVSSHLASLPEKNALFPAGTGQKLREKKTPNTAPGLQPDAFMDERELSKCKNRAGKTHFAHTLPVKTDAARRRRHASPRLVTSTGHDI